MAVQSNNPLPPGRLGVIDPSRQAEYPVILGQSFTEQRSTQKNQFLDVRYNWKSKKVPQRQVITETNGNGNSFDLAVLEDDDEPYRYSGSIDPTTDRSHSACLALIFDKGESAFVLESISRSLNFNLTSATTKSNIDQLPRLETVKLKNSDLLRNEDNDAMQSNGSDAADAGNPYDFRHYLAEAKKEAEAGNSPSKILSTTTESPSGVGSKTITTSKSTPALQSPFMGPSSQMKTQPLSKSQGLSKGTRALSKALDVNSKTVGTPSKTVGVKKLPKKVLPAAKEQGAVPKSQATFERKRSVARKDIKASSPQIIVDEASDLTIDLGSPPPATKSKLKINPDAFSRKHTMSSPANTASISPSPRDDANRGRVTRGDVESGESDYDSGNDTKEVKNNNDDVSEDLSLPSPQRTGMQNGFVGRISQDVGDDEEDDGLAAELEAAFEQEDDKDGNMVGLGILGQQPPAGTRDEEESEVSEEE